MTIRIVAPIAVMFAVAALPVGAQTQRSGSADARVMQQLQQVSSERAALQAENAKLKEQLEQMKKDLQKASSGKTALENRARVLEANAGRGEAASKQSEEQLERTRGQMQELITKFRETAQTLRDVETERSTVQGQLGLKERELKTCVDRNAGLYNLDAEVLDRMENRGFWSSLSSSEPFTKIKRVELENLIEDYKYRADELRLEQQKKEQSTVQRQPD